MYWFRPGWYGDIQVWTGADPEWGKAESIWLRHTPWGLRRMINWVSERYPAEIARGGIWITENGISLEEKFADVNRYQNIYLHFNEVLKSIKNDGINVRGHCIWSLMDNFEWIAGYHDNFGLYHVEFNGEPAGSELPDVWPKSSVPRIAKFINSPVYQHAVDAPSINESFPDEFEFGVATRGVEIERNSCENNIWNLDINNPLWSPPKTSADAQVKGIRIFPRQI